MAGTVEDLALDAGGGAVLAARLHRPPAERTSGAAVLLVAAPGATAEPALAGVAEGLGAAGLTALVLAPARGADGAPPGDRAALGQLDRALAWLAERPEIDAERLAAWGRGGAGTLAFLLGCHSRRLAAAVCVRAPLVAAELSAARPVQPLEMALNLGCPVLAVFDEGDAAAPPEHAAAAERVLSQFAREFDIVVRPPSAEGPSRAAADAALADELRRGLAFLAEHLEA